MKIEVAEKHKKYFERAEKNKIPQNILKLVDRKIDFIKYNFKHPGLNTEKLNNETLHYRDKSYDIWSFRINLKYRVCFIVIDMQKIILFDISNHYDTKFPAILD